jgi:signal peptidase II
MSEAKEETARKAVPPNRYLLYFSIATVGCLADLATKSWIFARLGMPGGPTWWLWQDVLGFQTTLNEGALFGLGQGLVPAFAALSVVAAVATLWWLFVAGAARDCWLTIALGSITAGIFGNLYDRLGFPGLHWNYPSPTHQVGDQVYAVRDWILVMIGNWPWPNFNIADSLLLCGATILVWRALRHGEPKERESTPPAADPKI